MRDSTFFIPMMLEPKMFSYTAKAIPEGPTIELFRLTSHTEGILSSLYIILIILTLKLKLAVFELFYEGQRSDYT